MMNIFLLFSCLPGINQLRLMTITGCSFDIVEPDGFRGISEVDKFEIIDSKFGRLGKHAFAHISNIAEFFLWSNSFEDLSGEAFMGLNNIQMFQLIRNNITRMGHDLFKDANAIKTATVYQNKIGQVDSGSLESLAVISGRMALRDNTFRCTCELAWMLEQPVLEEFLDSNQCSFSGPGQAALPDNTFLLSEVNRDVLCPVYGRKKPDNMDVEHKSNIISDGIDINQYASIPYFNEEMEVMDQTEDSENEQDRVPIHSFGEQFQDFGLDDAFEIEDSFADSETYDDRADFNHKSTAEHTSTVQTITTEAQVDKKSVEETLTRNDTIEIEEAIKRDEEYSTVGQKEAKDETKYHEVGSEHTVTTVATRPTVSDEHSTIGLIDAESTKDKPEISWSEDILYPSTAGEIDQQTTMATKQAGDEGEINRETEATTVSTPAEDTVPVTDSSLSAEEDEVADTIMPIIETFDVDISPIGIFNHDMYGGESSQPTAKVSQMPKTEATTASTQKQSMAPDTLEFSTIFTQPDESVTATVAENGEDQTRKRIEPELRTDLRNHRPHMIAERLKSQVEKSSASALAPLSFMFVLSLAFSVLGKP